MNLHVKPDRMKHWTLSDVGRANLVLASAAVPVPADNEILVKVSAVSLNYRDLLLIDGGLGFAAKAEPFVPTSDAAGVVVMAGASVTRFRSEDRVISTFIPGWVEGTGFGTAREPNDRTLGGSMPGVLAEYIAALPFLMLVAAHADHVLPSARSVAPSYTAKDGAQAEYPI